MSRSELRELRERIVLAREAVELDEPRMAAAVLRDVEEQLTQALAREEAAS